MATLKIGAYGRLDHYGPETERLGEVLAAARAEVEDAKAAERALAISGSKAAEAADKALADQAFANGEPMPGTPNMAAYQAAVIEAGARLRAARIAEAKADEALFLALVDNVDTAEAAADVALEEAADAHRKAIDALAASRARLLAAEQARRYVDGVRQAASYKPTDPWSQTFPIGPAQRPAKRNGNFLMPMRVRIEEIDKGLAAIRDEIEVCLLKPDETPAQATEQTPASERRFASDQPKRRHSVRAQAIR